MHEVCGAEAFVFAFALAGQLRGPFVWVQESWDVRQMNLRGFVAFANPADMTVCRTGNQAETLAIAEETLRSGAVPLVVIVFSQPIELTEGRRLQLATRDGQSSAVAIIPEGMGSNAAETRRHCITVYEPKASQDSTLQHWCLIENKSGTVGAWYVRWDTTSRRIIVVSSPRE